LPLFAITAWCGRRGGSMIFIPNVCEVAPPHTRGVIWLSKFATEIAMKN
jgi:hypothetical protein